MLKPNFILTHKIPIEITRRELGSHVDGDWVEGATTTFTAMVNIQPLKPYEIYLMPESERTRSWWQVFSADVLRTEKEGSWSADEFTWKDDRYKIMKVEDWTNGMRILEHVRCVAVRVELTPDPPSP